jgi:hypothetical protein
MKKQAKQNRRDFLKLSVAGAAALSMDGLMIKNASAATGLAWPDTGALTINPAIDNLRVVACNDPTMIKGTATGTFQSFNNALDVTKLQTNLDKMAMALAQKNDAKTAWATIFRKPDSKTWAQVNVAIKVNTVDSNDSPKLSIIAKICTALNTIGTTTTDSGVPFKNITIYDSNANVTLYSSTYAAALLPAGIKVVQNLGSSVSSYALPKGTATLTAGSLNNGSIDILVNIAMNKGHDQFDKGKTTLCLKNHYGSFSPQGNTYPKYNGNGCGNLDYLIDINKSDPILGGTPPRQQLCIVDSLWAMESGPSGGTIVQNNRLVMGTFAGAVDYLVAKKIRQAIMNIKVGTVDPGVSTNTTMNSAAIDGYLTGFGYSLTAANVANLDFIDALTWTPTAIISDASNTQYHTTSLRIEVSHDHLKTSRLAFTLPHGASTTGIAVFEMNGRMIRELPPPTLGSNPIVFWDARTNDGRTVPMGNYIVKIVGEGFEKTGSIVISR